VGNAPTLARAIDINPLNWLGDTASAAATDAWTSAMTALWSCGVWILQLAFKVIDAFTTPDLSSSGPLAQVLPYTFYLGAATAGLIGFLQLGAALFRREGKSVARVFIGIGQFALVWVGYIGIAALLVTAAAGLTRGLLNGLLHVNSFAAVSVSDSWPRQAGDAAVATALGLCTVFLIFPAAIGYILIMLVREAALMLLVATSPISAAGLLSDATRTWFWKTLRWFIVSLLIAPMAALVLGLGVKISQGVIAGDGDQTAAAVGMAVVGCVLVLIGAVSPLVLFRLFAFVDPGTPSGASMRQAFDTAGGASGLFGGGAMAGGGQHGSGASVRQSGAGQSQGEATAATATTGRFAGVFGTAGQAFQKGQSIAASIATKTTAISADVLASAGVGHQAPYYGQDAALRNGDSGSQPAPGERRHQPPPASDGDSGATGQTPPSSEPPTPGAPTPGGTSPPAGGASEAAGGAAIAADAAPILLV
jgi:type IV secretion system protein TrbL